STWAEGATDVFDGLEKAAIEEIIANYIVENPELIVRALGVLEERQAAAAVDQRLASLAANREVLENSPGSPVGGALDGDVTVVEFFDYRCPYCKTVAPAVAALIGENGVRVVYKEFPILGPESVFAARAALAAHRQGLYQEFHNAVMGQRRVTEKSVLAAARKLGLDMEKLQRDMASPEIEKQLRDNFLLAQSLGITGTPAFVIGDQLVPGLASLEQLKSSVVAARR
ncbi:MAG: DsbA family protein, partial [Alphaproteobacteria bacterium]